MVDVEFLVVILEEELLLRIVLEMILLQKYEISFVAY